MAVLANDSFTRANNASAWGTADVAGGLWNRAAGAGVNSIASDQGKIVEPTANSTQMAQLPSATTSADMEVLVRFASSASASFSGGVMLRVTASTTGYLVWTSNGQFRVVKLVTGSTTNIGTSTTFAITANQAYWIRARIQGSNILGKIWQDGTTEPVAWQQVQTDASITGAGWMGVRYTSGAINDFIVFDHFYAQDLTFAQADSGDTLTGSDAGAWEVAQSATDAVSGSETLSLALAMQGATDTAAGSDALTFASVSTGSFITGTDQGTAIETSAFAFLYAPVESVPASEVVALAFAQNATETVSASDTALSAQTLALVESAGVSDASTVALAQSGIDGLSGSDALAATLAQSLTETLSTSEAGVFALVWASSDTGTPQDVSTLTLAQRATDQLSAVENALVAEAIASIESIVSSESALSVETFAPIETLAGSESALVASVFTSSESLGSSDLGAWALFSSSIENATVLDAVGVALAQRATDQLAAPAESALWAELLGATDAALVSDLFSFFSGSGSYITGVEQASASENAVFSVVVFQTDMLVGVEALAFAVVALSSLVIWRARDMQAVWQARDAQAVWETRDEQAVWKARH